MTSFDIRWTLIPKRARGNTLVMTAFVSPKCTEKCEQLPPALREWPQKLRDWFPCAAAPCACSSPCPDGPAARAVDERRMSLHVVFRNNNGAEKSLPASVKTCPLEPNMWEVFFGNASVTSDWIMKTAAQHQVVTNLASKSGEHLTNRYAGMFDSFAREPRPVEVAALGDVSAAVRKDPFDLSNLRLWGRPAPAHPAPAPLVTPTQQPLAPPEPTPLDAIGAIKKDVDDKPTTKPAAVQPLVVPKFVPDSKSERLAARIAQRVAPNAVESTTPLAASLTEVKPRASAYNEPEDAVFLGAVAFHRRAVAPSALPSMISASPEPPPVFDFNHRFAILSTYPALLRPLGLALEIEVTGDLRELSQYDDIRLQIGPKEAMSGMTPCLPRTAFELAESAPEWTFHPASAPDDAGSAPSPLVRGVLRHQASIAPDARDVDGAVAKLFAQANQPADEKPSEPERRPRKPAPPAVRSSGISLVDRDRGRTFEKMLKRTDEIACAHTDTTVLHADDLLRGFFVEVKAGETWYPIGRREETYEYGSKSDPETSLPTYCAGTRDAVVRTSATRVQDETTKIDQATEEIHLSESIFRWEGWSLAAALPFRATMCGETPAETITDNPAVPWRLKTTFRAAERSLPPLRFGGDYRFRVRGADLAGDLLVEGDPPPDQTFPKPDDPPFRYLRYDPVPPPTVLLTEPLRPEVNRGETLRQLVVGRGPHGDFGTDYSMRCLIPPATTFWMAEQHKMYSDKKKPSSLGGFKELRLELNPEQRTRDRYGWHLPADDSASPIARQTPNLPAYHYREFLPDPMAKYVCVRIEDLVGGEIIDDIPPCPFYPSGRAWPNGQRIYLRLQTREASRARITWQWLQRPDTLVIALPPGWVARLTISCGFDADDLRAFGHYADWHRLMSDPANDRVPLCEERELRNVQHKILCGCHPMISPREELYLVHATSRPLRAPAFEEAVFEGRKVATAADVRLRVAIDRKSTVAVRIDGKWKEPDDRPDRHETAAGPIVRSITATLDPLPVPSPEESGDFDAQGAGIVEESRQHLFGDTRYRRVAYSAVAESRFAPYFDDRPSLAVTRDGERAVEVDILSSARPPAPVVRHIIPLFDWRRAKEGFDIQPWQRLESARRTSLRIWLERGWYASGDGEMLGVVLWPSMSDVQRDALNRNRPVSFNTPGEPPREIEPFVTRWGRDPLWKAAMMPTMPTAHHFTGAEQYVTSLRLKETESMHDDSDYRVSLAAYRPQYSAEQQGWFCDIDIHPIPSYFCFVRLALVRYQPNSLRNVEISSVSVADFAQLVPDRTVTVRRRAEDAKSLSIEIFGPGSAGSTEGSLNQIVIAVERRCSSARGEFTWSPDRGIRVERQKGSKDALWSGIVTFPESGGDRRLVIREFEVFRADACPDPNDACDAVTTLRNHQSAGRLIYADVLDLK